MSLFDAAPGGGDDAATSPDAETETLDSAPEPEATSEPVSIPVPAPKLSRRAQAAEEAKRERAEFAERERKYQERLAEVESRAARLQSEMAMRPVQVVQQQPVQQQQVEDPDPAKLRREAARLLDAKDFDGYQEKMEEAALARVRREFAPQFARQQQYQQQPQQNLDPQTIALLGEFSDVINSPNGLKRVFVADEELALDGHPPSPARVRAAMMAVRQKLAAGKGRGDRAQYSQQAAGVLGGSPTSRGSGAATQSAGPTVSMTSDEERTARAIAKKAGMSWDEYVEGYARANPQMVRR